MRGVNGTKISTPSTPFFLIQHSRLKTNHRSIRLLYQPSHDRGQLNYGAALWLINSYRRLLHPIDPEHREL